MPVLFVEEVFVTEGIPQYTFVKPPNYNEILIDVRKRGKPVIIEGQSGTGKTTTVKKIIEQLGGDTPFIYLSAREPLQSEQIGMIVNERTSGSYIIDDFHRLSERTQKALADIAKLAAEQGEDSRLPKLIIIGINQVGSNLIQLVEDLAKRCGIHKIQPGERSIILDLIEAGSKKLNIEIQNADSIYEESRGDYWLTQHLCQAICSMAGVIEQQQELKVVTFDTRKLREKVVARLESAYYPAVKEFCRGKRFRTSNDPYFKLLKAVSQQESSIVDLNDIAGNDENVRGSINNLKEKRLSKLLDTKPVTSKHFYYNPQTKYFAIEDPALFYFLKHLNWEKLRKDCGFREGTKAYTYDIALSFAGENRELAKFLAEQFETLDVPVFYDELYEANFLGKALTKQFVKIFKEESRFILCLLDKNHADRVWPTFERECFLPRVEDGSVIPVFIDDTIFVGIPQDIYGISFKVGRTGDAWKEIAVDEIIFKLIDKLDNL